MTIVNRFDTSQPSPPPSHKLLILIFEFPASLLLDEACLKLLISLVEILPFHHRTGDRRPFSTTYFALTEPRWITRSSYSHSLLSMPNIGALYPHREGEEAARAFGIHDANRLRTTLHDGYALILSPLHGQQEFSALTGRGANRDDDEFRANGRCNRLGDLRYKNCSCGRLRLCSSHRLLHLLQDKQASQPINYFLHTPSDTFRPPRAFEAALVYLQPSL